jgi:hypothetical protein
MLAVLLVAAQISAATAVDSTYSTPAVRRLVERASVSNRRVPDSLRAYRARVESELAFVARQADGTEQTFSVEQMYVGLFTIAIIGYAITLALNELERLIVPWKTA